MSNPNMPNQASEPSQQPLTQVGKAAPIAEEPLETAAAADQEGVEDAVTEASEESFPASDAPAWTRERI